MICFFPFLHLVGSTTAWFIHLIWFACRFSSFFPSPLSSSFNRLACTFFINLVSQWWYIYDYVAKTESHCVFVFRVSDIRHENTIITYIRLTFIRSLLLLLCICRTCTWIHCAQVFNDSAHSHSFSLSHSSHCHKILKPCEFIGEAKFSLR